MKRPFSDDDSGQSADPMRARFVPIEDAPLGHGIYDRSLIWLSLLGASAGALMLGALGYAVAEGGLPIAGIGQFAAAGWGVATFTAAGVGVVLGGLAGGLFALFRLPRAPSPPPMSHHSHRHT